MNVRARLSIVRFRGSDRTILALSPVSRSAVCEGLGMVIRLLVEAVSALLY